MLRSERGNPTAFNRGVLGSSISAHRSRPHVDWTWSQCISSINIINSSYYTFFVMNFAPWTAAHRSGSARRSHLTNLIACVNFIRPSHSQDILQTLSRPFHYSVSRRSVPDPIATAIPSSGHRRPKKMSDIPGRNEAKPRGTPAVPSPSARYIHISHTLKAQRATCKLRLLTSLASSSSPPQTASSSPIASAPRPPSPLPTSSQVATSPQPTATSPPRASTATETTLPTAPARFANSSKNPASSSLATRHPP
jgi:hypothetical protein